LSGYGRTPTKQPTWPNIGCESVGLLDASPINPVTDLSGTSNINVGYVAESAAFVVDSNYDVWAGAVDNNLQPVIVCFDGWTLKAKKYINATEIRMAMYTPLVESMNLYHTEGTDYIVMGASNSAYSGLSSAGYVVAVFRLSDCTLVGQYPFIKSDVLDVTDVFNTQVVTQYLPAIDQKGNFFFTWQGFHDDVHGNQIQRYDSYIIRVYMPGGVSDFVGNASPAYMDVKRWRIDGNATVGNITNIMYDGDDETLIAFTDTGVIYKIDASDGAILQTSAPGQFNLGNVSFDVTSMMRGQKATVSNGRFYLPKAGTGNGEKLAAFDATDLSLIGYYDPRTFPHMPSTGANLSQGTLIIDPVGNSFLLNTFAWPVPDYPAGFANRYAMYRLYLDRIATGGYGCDQIVKDICMMAGIPEANIDVDAIAPLTVMGYPVAQIQAGKDMINVLAQIKFFEGRESDFKMQFIPRGQDAIETISSDDLGMDGDKCHMTELLSQEQDRPKVVEVMFTNPDLDYQQDKQNRVRHSRTMNSKNITSISTPVVMTAYEAAGIADRILWTAEAEARTFRTSTHKAYNLLFDPCDVLGIVADDGHTFTARITQAQMGQNFASAWELTSEDSNNYVSAQGGVSDTGFVPQTLTGLSPTLWWLLDMPYLTDSDADGSGNTGFYVAGDPSATGGAWRGFALYNSSDNAAFSQQSASIDAVAYGAAANVLAAPRATDVWDDVNTLRVKMINGDSPSSTSDLNVLNGANAAILVSSGEVIQWGTATLNSDGSYTLSHLLRGRRGTESSCGKAVLGEKVLFPLTQGGLHRNQAAQTLIGLNRYWKAVTIGADINSPIPVLTHALQGNDLKPYSPAQLAGSRDSSNNLTLRWQRRTRLAGDWRDGQGSVSLSEDSEVYDVEIVVSGVVVRTMSDITPPGGIADSWTSPSQPHTIYSAANQTSDGILLDTLSHSMCTRSPLRLVEDSRPQRRCKPRIHIFSLIVRTYVNDSKPERAVYRSEPEPEGSHRQRCVRRIRWRTRLRARIHDERRELHTEPLGISE
jgi:hypothetical protein